MLLIKFCFSWVCLFVVQDATQHLVNSWNYHRVPGPQGCVPVENMMASKNTAPIQEFIIPTTAEAVRMYEESGGQLNHESAFGQDPLLRFDIAFNARKRMFNELSQSNAVIFSDIVHGNINSLKHTLDLFIYLTRYLSNEYL